MPRALRKIYQLKISLKGSKPPIWRRCLINSAMSLPEFHRAIQMIMGWTDSHLHQFIAGGTYFGTPDPEWDSGDVYDERKVRVDELLTREKDSLIYEYDFGDSWEHKVTLEKITPFAPGSILPVCIKAKGACPPEDVGGIWGYYSFLEALSDSEHPEHERVKEWIGGEFDPAVYDIDEANQLLGEYFRSVRRP